MTKLEGQSFGTTRLIQLFPSFVIRHSYNGYQRSTSKIDLVRTVVFTCDRGWDGDHAPPFQKHALPADEGDDGIPGGKMGPAVAWTLSRPPCLGGRTVMATSLCG